MKFKTGDAELADEEEIPVKKFRSNRMLIQHRPILTEESLKKAFELHGLIYICTTDSAHLGGGIFDLMYQPNPDFSLGHSHWAGLQHGKIFNADFMIDQFVSCASVIGKNQFRYSSHRHDFVWVDDDQTSFIDGGRAYIRCSGNLEFLDIKISKTGPEYNHEGISIPMEEIENGRYN